MLNFAVERWGDVLAEIEPLFVKLYEEAGTDAGVPMHVDRDLYDAIDHSGRLRVVTARAEGGTLAGYALVIVMPHHHYADTLHGIIDMVYLRPVHRKGAAGLSLLRFIEADLRKHAVRKLVGASRVGDARDISALYRRLGFTEEEHGFGKVLS